MERDQMIESVKAQMPEKRWKHTEGVMATAVQLAVRFGENPEQAELAAILHDVAKYWPVDRMEKVLRDQKLAPELLAQDKNLWHAEVGAWVAEHEYGVTDALVLDAIRFHTSGRLAMTRLDKVVCLADYMEPGRDFPGVDDIRRLSKDSLEQALLAGFDSTILLLLKKGKAIFPLTIEARNGLIEELKTGG
ncbi:putative HD superfamily hydrolase of NAD metabolism [Paenibacillus algorifonticola]|uniref:bis(5'-nucleosyl)-tetraphosphatase (symmetrical) n=1 Tax=Paenibacillus algorifonticola TaxID=684063 RepID=A0A1I1YR81_9BACL|nr:bis(5'-nucleosyl)-tetraphosphatase (symmetrical) YqeK [Paenibacillus algorifonticola]SFE21538.1 putative HD superfamily hydrolase of NAD metabolism [Paenibacillus algorifonticola]